MGLTFSKFRLYNSEIEFNMFVNLWIWEIGFDLELTVEKVDNSMNSWLTAIVVVERLRFENQSLGNWFENLIIWRVMQLEKLCGKVVFEC